MKAQNLRVGNYIKAGGHISEIVAISKDQVDCIHVRNSSDETITLEFTDTSIDTVPLNEKVLTECCGFDNERRLKAKEMYLQYTKNNSGYIMLQNTNKETLIHFWEIKTLHQLQNLYYALTSTELSIALDCLVRAA